jgi:hypothetical protein
MTIFQFFLASLATYRFTVLIARDGCPLDVCKRIRKLAPKWLGCPFCFSVTAAALIEAGFYMSGVRDSFIVSACIVLAMSAISIMLDRLFTSDHLA